MYMCESCTGNAHLLIIFKHLSINHFHNNNNNNNQKNWSFIILMKCFHQDSQLTLSSFPGIDDFLRDFSVRYDSPIIVETPNIHARKSSTSDGNDVV